MKDWSTSRCPVMTCPLIVDFFISTFPTVTNAPCMLNLWSLIVSCGNTSGKLSSVRGPCRSWCIVNFVNSGEVPRMLITTVGFCFVSFTSRMLSSSSAVIEITFSFLSPASTPSAKVMVFTILPKRGTSEYALSCSFSMSIPIAASALRLPRVSENSTSCSVTDPPAFAPEVANVTCLRSRSILARMQFRSPLISRRGSLQSVPL
mmetsp:Transcript_9674/g.24283  ORF Transcript_9674/g.24283 Transcript_9674/m.24283 type:complete len:205 (+) Transcript_9674:179-793(+)